MTNVEDESMAVDPEMERIWREDDEPSFSDVRASIQEDETEEVAELEQPEDTDDTEDSIDSTEDNEDNEDTEEDSEESKPTDVEDKSKDVSDNGTHKVKANGMEFDFTTEELKALAPKAMDYTKKMQEIAPWRKTISALKEQGIGETDVNLMIDVLKGDKNAIAEVLKRTQVDPLDLDTDSKAQYMPNNYGKDERSLAIEDVVSEISSDVEYAATVKVVDEVWDDASRDVLVSNPSMIKGLHNDIKEGIYSKVAPLAEKLKVLDGGRKSALDYYVEAGRQYFAQQASTQQMQEVKVPDVRQTEIKEMANKRKAASPTKANAGKRDVIDYLDDNDEEYDEWYKRTMSSR